MSFRYPGIASRIGSSLTPQNARRQYFLLLGRFIAFSLRPGSTSAVFSSVGPIHEQKLEETPVWSLPERGRQPASAEVCLSIGGPAHL